MTQEEKGMFKLIGQLTAYTQNIYEQGMTADDLRYRIKQRFDGLEITTNEAEEIADSAGVLLANSVIV